MVINGYRHTDSRIRSWQVSFISQVSIDANILPLRRLYANGRMETVSNRKRIDVKHCVLIYRQFAMWIGTGLWHDSLAVSPRV